MRVLLAGATGALGIPLTRRLIAHGHEVIGLTRRPAQAPVLAVDTSMIVFNAKAKAELGWKPEFATYRDGRWPSAADGTEPALETVTGGTSHRDRYRAGPSGGRNVLYA